MERLVDFIFFALSVLAYFGSISAPNDATLKQKAHALQCTTAGPYYAKLTDFLRAGSACGLGIDLFWIRILSLAARFRTAANSNSLADGLAEIGAAREHDGVSFFVLIPEWNKKFLKTSMAHSKMEAYEYVRHLDHAGKIPSHPAIKNKRPPRPCSAIQKRDFTLTIATRATKILGPICRHLIAKILPMIMCNAARASRRGLAVGILRVLCNGMCTARRFHKDVEEQRCGAGCHCEPDSLCLSHYNECPSLYNFVTTAWRNAAILPRGGHPFHDLITQIFLRSLQNGIVVTGCCLRPQPSPP